MSEVSEVKPIVIAKVGSTYSPTARLYGDFEAMIAAFLGDDAQLQVIDVRAGEPMPAVAACAAVIITGSHDMVTDALPWSLQLEDWVRLAHGQIPLLGICYGHQLIARALGGEVGDNPRGKEVGTYEVQSLLPARSDVLWQHLPEQFFAQLTHTQSVLRLPLGAVLLGYSEREPHQGFRVGDKTWGVQFHPEFTEQVVQDYIHVNGDSLQQQGDDLVALQQAVVATPFAASLLHYFRELAQPST